MSREIRGAGVEELFKSIVIPYLRKCVALDGGPSPDLSIWPWSLHLMDNNGHGYISLNLLFPMDTPSLMEGAFDGFTFEGGEHIKKEGTMNTLKRTAGTGISNLAKTIAKMIDGQGEAKSKYWNWVAYNGSKKELKIEVDLKTVNPETINNLRTTLTQIEARGDFTE